MTRTRTCLLLVIDPAERPVNLLLVLIKWTFLTSRTSAHLFPAGGTAARPWRPRPTWAGPGPGGTTAEAGACRAEAAEAWWRRKAWRVEERGYFNGCRPLKRRPRPRPSRWFRPPGSLVSLRMFRTCLDRQSKLEPGLHICWVIHLRAEPACWTGFRRAQVNTQLT